jgi:hypothetical protein
MNDDQVADRRDGREAQDADGTGTRGRSTLESRSSTDTAWSGEPPSAGKISVTVPTAPVARAAASWRAMRAMLS